MCKTVRGLGLTTALVVFTLSGPAVAQPAVSAATLVTINSGSLLGIATGDVISFKGIAYAAPPVGALRWRAPQPLSTLESRSRGGAIRPKLYAARRCAEIGRLPYAERLAPSCCFAPYRFQ